MREGSVTTASSVGGPFGPQSPESDKIGSAGRPQRKGDLVRHLAAFIRAVRWAPNSRRVYLLVAAVVVVVGITVFGQIRLNVWQRDFYDALAERQLDDLLTQLLVFCGIIAVLLTLGVAQTWLRETIKIDLREAISGDLLDQWLQPRRAYRLGWASDVGANPDQRIHEDSRHLCELCAELGIGLLQSTFLLISFVGVLWVLSENVALAFGGWRLEIPGYMVWAAFAYAFAGSWATWRVGRPLVALNAELYAREADFRFLLVHTNESAEAIGLYGGEQGARKDVDATLERVLAVMRRLARGLANLTWVTAGYGWLALVAPIVVAAPGYFSGTLTFGELMMVTGAFFQVQQSLRWFVDNFSRIADWRATLLRVMALRLALPGLDSIDNRAARISLGRHPAGKLSIAALSVAMPDKHVKLVDEKVELAPGERLLISGGPGSGKSMLFRAIAGLWPWGSGQVQLPPAEQLLFLPQRPYLPIGSLRAVLAYPAPAERFTDAEVKRAIGRVGLGHLLRHLDVVRRWDKELGLEDQQSLAFARLLLHRPKWVAMDDPWSALDAPRRAALCSIFDQELAGTAVLGMGRSMEVDSFFNRVAQLVEVPDAEPLRMSPTGYVTA